MVDVPSYLADVVGELPSMQGVVMSAEMDVTLPDGREVVVEMHDDGINGDLQADDGVYAAVFEAPEVRLHFCFMFFDLFSLSILVLFLSLSICRQLTLFRIAWHLFGHLHHHRQDC